MNHLEGITTTEYLECINSFWAFYKEHAHTYPERFKEYIGESKLKPRLSHNPHDDKWYLIKVAFPSGFYSNHNNLTT
jgi:hypothetical protein